jgi:hypothetical protein
MPCSHISLGLSRTLPVAAAAGHHDPRLLSIQCHEVRAIAGRLPYLMAKEEVEIARESVDQLGVDVGRPLERVRTDAGHEHLHGWAGTVTPVRVVNLLEERPPLCGVRQHLCQGGSWAISLVTRSGLWLMRASPMTAPALLAKT